MKIEELAAGQSLSGIVQVLQTIFAHHARYGGTEHGDIGRANAGAARAPAPRTSEIDD
jgi:hypothetical protein